MIPGLGTEKYKMNPAFLFDSEDKEALMGGRSKGRRSQTEVASTGQKGDELRPTECQQKVMPIE